MLTRQQTIRAHLHLPYVAIPSAHRIAWWLYVNEQEQKQEKQDETPQPLGECCMATAWTPCPRCGMEEPCSRS